MKVCLICRVKDVKCDGGSPKCSLCKKLDIECRYGHVPYQEKNLKRGDACIPCSRKKKRCDAAKPSCSTCKNLRKSKECVYRDSKSSNPSQALQKILSIASTSSKNWLSQGSNSDSLAPSNALVSSRPHIQASLEMPDQKVLELNADWFSESLFSRNASGFQTSWIPAQTQNDTDSTMSRIFDITSSFDHINTPDHQNSWIDFANPISPPLTESLDILNYNFRLTYLAHRHQFGVYMPFMKQQAILLGDRSNSFVHPFFIHVAEFWGCHLYQERRRDFSLQDLETKYCKVTYASMKTIRDPSVMVGACHYLAKICYYVYALHDGNRYRQKVKDIVKKYNIRFLPESNGSHVYEMSEDEHSKASFLAELVSSDLVLRYVLGDREDEDLFSDFEQQFRLEFPQIFPSLYETCPFVLRAVSIVCFKDVQKLIALYQDYGASIVKWLPECDDLASCLVARVATLSSRISYCVEVWDHDTCISFRNSKIIILTALAELYNASATASSSFPDVHLRYKTQYRRVIDEIVETTTALDPTEFHFLDPIAGICWSRITSLLMEDALCQDSNYPLQDYIDKLSRAKYQLEASIRLKPPPSAV